jgi:multiple antibiotic resistance protein
VIDIIGNIPIIIDLRKKVGHIQSEKHHSLPVPS